MKLLLALAILLTLPFSISLAHAQLAPPDLPPDVVLDQLIQSIDKNAGPCQQACAAIASYCSGCVFVGKTGNFEFWDAKQAELIPACRVEPSSVEDLSRILSVIIGKSCHFAVKSGGHERTPGASNAEGGVTIDLVRLDAIQVAEDRSSVAIGAGLLWGDVYRALEKEELMVLGGRVADVGVGGLLLGGGISFFSNAHGLACDSIISYELVLPNTSVVTVSQSSRPDLYRALRGAGPMNFGIISSFTVEAFPLAHGIWNGQKLFPREAAPQLLQANYDVATQEMESDPHIAIMNAFTCHPQYNLCCGIVFAHHTTHNSTERWPSSLKRYVDIQGLPQPVELQIRPVSNSTQSFVSPSPPGTDRAIYGTTTYTPSVELESRILEVFQEETNSLRNVAGFSAGVIMHPFSTTMIASTRKNGGNAFRSIADHRGPLIVLNIAWQWSDKLDDEKAYAAYYRLMDRIEGTSKQMGKWHPYKYINYAEATQDVWEGYADVAGLRKLQKEVDPEGIFARDGLAGGVHKLNDFGWRGRTRVRANKPRLGSKDEL